MMQVSYCPKTQGRLVDSQRTGSGRDPAPVRHTLHRERSNWDSGIVTCVCDYNKHSCYAWSVKQPPPPATLAPTSSPSRSSGG